MGKIAMGLTFFLMGFIFFINSLAYTEEKNMGISSATFPRFISVLMIIYSFILIFSEVRIFFKSNTQINIKQLRFPLKVRGVLAVIATIIFYLSFEWLGYIISGIFLMIIYSILLQKEKLKIFDTFIFPIATIVSIYFIFRYINVFLPTGEIFTQ